MALFTIENLTFTYPAAAEAVLKNINLTVNNGDFVVICGKSGSGKSTLLRHFKTELTPAGNQSGRIFFYNKSLDSVSQREQAQRIGFVMQNPDNQIVTDKVWHELAFGLESLGTDEETIRLRTAETASFFGMQNLFDARVDTLSGGQKQLLNLAAVMAMQPEVLILDEPTSRLDPIAAGEFLEAVKRINRELGTTVIIAEHRLEDVLAASNKAVVMAGGKIIIDEAPEKAAAMLAASGSEMFTSMPVAMRVYAELAADGIGQSFQCPIDVRSGRLYLSKIFEKKAPEITEIKEELEKPACINGGECLNTVSGGAGDIKSKSKTQAVQLRDVWFRYEKNGRDIIKDFSLDIYKGEFFAVIGANGTGKTTLLRLICGLAKPYRGAVRICEDSIAHICLLPQSPQTVFSENTLRKDLLRALDERERACQKASENRRSENTDALKSKEGRLLEITKLTDTEKLLDMHPYDLSGGEQQRAALAKLLVYEPDILLLDEPTKGIDNYFKQQLAEILHKLCQQGKTVVIVSHDTDFCAEHADRCAMIFDGRIMKISAPREFFSGNSFYTTAANRMSRHIFKNAVSVRDVVTLVRVNLQGEKLNDADLNGKTKYKSEIKNAGAAKKEQKQKNTSEMVKSRQEQKSNAEVSKTVPALITALALLLAASVPFLGIYLMNDRKYYIISFAVAVLAIVPFAVSFERRRPKTGEVMIIAVLTAIAVCGRAIFFMTPNFKPVSAIAIIAGAFLGPQAGFLVGALSGFVSDFFFGQGPWTPWQMCGFGAVGLIAGALGKSGLIMRRRAVLAAFGAVITFFVYGGIVDLWTLFGFYERPTLAAAAAVYGAAVPFNLVHAASSAVFLYFLAEPMGQKLERIKLKYGLGFAKGARL